MVGKIGGLSPRVKLVAGCAAALVVLAAVALVVLLVGSGGSSISDSAHCEDFVKSDPGEQSAYLTEKLEDLGEAGSPQEAAAYAEGFRLNCSKGYPNSTVGREFEATQSEMSEAGNPQEGVALIRERTEGREVFGEVNRELEGH